MASGDDAARVVITGVGVVSPIGIGHESFWASLAAGRGGIAELSAPSPAPLPLPLRLAAEITDFDPLDYLPSRKLLKVMSRDIQLGVAASRLAIDDAGLARGELDPERVGVSFGAGRISSLPEDLAAATGFVDPEAEADADEAINWTRWGEDSLGRIAPMWLLRRLPNMSACHVSIGLDARGPNNTITSRDTSALLALAEGVRVIERGAADCMVVGASGSLLQPIDLVKLSLSRTLSQHVDDPATACRPFDAQRDGTVLGEGAAALVIERLETARARGATVHGEVIGCGAGCDGQVAGEGLVNAIAAALGDAGIEPGELGHVNAGATGSPEEDSIEARAIEIALGDSARSVPVTALAGYLGHSDAGGGALELAGCLLSAAHRLAPFTRGFRSAEDGCRLDIVAQAPVELSSHLGLSCNRTEFGQSAAVVVRAESPILS